MLKAEEFIIKNITVHSMFAGFFGFIFTGF